MHVTVEVFVHDVGTNLLSLVYWFVINTTNWLPCLRFSRASGLSIRMCSRVRSTKTGQNGVVFVQRRDNSIIAAVTYSGKGIAHHMEPVRLHSHGVIQAPFSMVPGQLGILTRL